MTNDRLMGRAVLVKIGNEFDRTSRPIEHNGFWDGHVSAVKVIKDSSGTVKDRLLTVRLRMPTSLSNKEITISFKSDRWKLRYPRKGE